MAHESKTQSMQSPVVTYARLLRQVHELISKGLGDSEEAEALADLMDDSWHAMTTIEQARMGGLSEDLYDLREGGPKQVNMTSEQLAHWQRAMKEAYKRYESGDVDFYLDFLRMPMPSQAPAQLIPYLQARCWDKLGDLETAVIFMKEADRLVPDLLSAI